MQPVGDSGRVKPGHVVHRLVAHVRLHRILAATRRSAVETDPAPRAAPHVCVVDRVGVGAGWIHRVEKLHIL